MGLMKSLSKSSGGSSIMHASRSMGGSLSGGTGGFISVATSQFFDRDAVLRRLAPAKRRYLSRAGAHTRMAARKLIKKMGRSRKEPRKFTSKGRISKAWRKWIEEIRSLPASPPGSPIHTHSENGARQAILYGLDDRNESTVIGYSADKFDQLGELHEFGGTRYGRRYPARPVMQPALANVQPKLPKLWADSIK